MNKPLSMDENTGTTLFQPDEDFPGVLEIEKNPFNEDKFVNHQACRLRAMLPRVAKDEIVMAVRQVLDEGKKFTKELLNEIAASLNAVTPQAKY